MGFLFSKKQTGVCQLCFLSSTYFFFSSCFFQTFLFLCAVGHPYISPVIFLFLRTLLWFASTYKTILFLGVISVHPAPLISGNPQRFWFCPFSATALWWQVLSLVPDVMKNIIPKITISFFLSSLLLSAYVRRPYLQHLQWYLLHLFLIHRVETFLVSKVLLKEIAATRARLRHWPCTHVSNVPFKPDLEWSSRRREIGGGRLLHSFRLVNCCVWEEQQSKCFLTMCTYTEDAGGVIAVHFHRDVAWVLIRFTGKTQKLGYTPAPQLSVSTGFFQPERAFCSSVFVEFRALPACWLSVLEKNVLAGWSA